MKLIESHFLGFFHLGVRWGPQEGISNPVTWQKTLVLECTLSLWQFWHNLLSALLIAITVRLSEWIPFKVAKSPIWPSWVIKNNLIIVQKGILLAMRKPHSLSLSTWSKHFSLSLTIWEIFLVLNCIRRYCVKSKDTYRGSNIPPPNSSVITCWCNVQLILCTILNPVDSPIPMPQDHWFQPLAKKPFCIDHPGVYQVLGTMQSFAITSDNLVYYYLHGCPPGASINL